MPFVSRAQQRWGHTAAGEKALGGPAAVAEWDSATKGEKLPARVKPTTHNSPPSLAEFASNNGSPSNRQNLNPAPGQLTFAQSEALSKARPQDWRTNPKPHPKAKNLKDPRRAPSDKAKYMHAAGMISNNAMKGYGAPRDQADDDGGPTAAFRAAFGGR